ncbi:hypothetical protein D1872_273320 [compost metagenome]
MEVTATSRGFTGYQVLQGALPFGESLRLDARFNCYCGALLDTICYLTLSPPGNRLGASIEIYGYIATVRLTKSLRR